MSMRHYREAVELMQASGREELLRLPQPEPIVDELERKLAVSLPEDYKQMVRDFGILGFQGFEIDGVGSGGVEAEGAPAVAWATLKRREKGLLSPTMVKIMSSGYGPEFVLDCAETPRTGEAPVHMVSLGGQQDDMEKVADSFGEFLLNEVRAAVERETT